MLVVFTVLIAGIVLCTWLGVGLSGWLPASVRPFAPVLAPVLGLVVLILVGYAAIQSVFDLRAALLIALGVATLFNLLERRRWWAAWREAAWREAAFVVLLTLAAFGTSVLLLVPLGRSLPVGGNWDNEIYLPTAELLQRSTLRALPTLPPHPLTNIPQNYQRAAFSLGYSIVHGVIGLVVGQSALATHYPVLCLLRALSVIGWAVLFRLLGLRLRWALWGAALTAAFSLALWSVLFGFGMQAAGMPLLPLGLVLLVAALRHGDWRSIALAGTTFAVMPMVYYPLVVSFLPLAVPLGAVILWQEKRRGAVLLTTAKLALVTFGLGAWTIVDWFRGFADGYSNQGPFAGITRFIGLGQVLGVTPFLRDGDERFSTLPQWLAPLAAGLPWLAGAAAAALLGLALLGLWRGTERAAWAALVAGAALYLAWMRWVSGGSGYPYGLLKASATVVLPVFGLAAAGAQAWEAGRIPALVRLHRGVWAVASVALLGLSVATLRTATPFWSATPLLYTPEPLAARALIQKVPPGATLLWSGDTRLNGPQSGLLSYFALQRRILGGGRTGFSSFPPNPNGLLGDWALLHAQEDPALYGYSVAERVGTNDLVALYRHDGPIMAQAVPPKPVLALDDERAFSVGGDGVRFADSLEAVRLHLATGTPMNFDGTAQVGIELVATAPVSVVVQLGDTTQTLTVPAGASRWWSAAIALPAPALIRAGGPVLVRGVTLARSDAAFAPGLAAQPPQAVIDPVLTVNGTTLELAATVLTPERITLSLDVWDGKRGQHWGWFGIEVPAARDGQRLAWQLDLATNSSAATVNDAAIFAAQQPETRADGDYTAVLGVSINNQPLLDPLQAFSFRVRSGTINDVVAWQRGLFSVGVWQPETMLDVVINDDTLLGGYTMPSTARPGATLPLRLFWQAQRGTGDERSVLVHLRNATGTTVAQGDGPPAGGSRPTSTWQTGDYIRDDRSLTLPADLAPGAYEIAIGMYRFPSITRLPLLQNGTAQPGDVVLLPLTVTP